MEKTDTIILSPEELAAYMTESTISVTSTYEHSPVVLMVDDTVIGALGNFSASIGKAKSKKTFNIYKVRFENENKSQSNEDKIPLYQRIITTTIFSLAFGVYSCLVLFRCIFVS